MRRLILVTTLMFGALSADIGAQQTTPPDTTSAPAQPTAKPDSTKSDTRATADAAHHRKILWWTGGIALFILLNLLISDRPSK
jgi:hypothetical protein